MCLNSTQQNFGLGSFCFCWVQSLSLFPPLRYIFKKKTKQKTTQQKTSATQNNLLQVLSTEKSAHVSCTENKSIIESDEFSASVYSVSLVSIDTDIFLRYLKEHTFNMLLILCLYCPYFRYLCFFPNHWYLVPFQMNDRCNIGLLPSRMDLPLHIPALSKCLGYPTSTSEMLWSVNCSYWVSDTPINLFIQHVNTHLFYLKLTYYIHSTI